METKLNSCFPTENKYKYMYPTQNLQLLRDLDNFILVIVTINLIKYKIM